MPNRFFSAFPAMILFVLTGCSSLLTGFYGIKTTEKINAETIARCAAEYNIPAVASYELDTAYFSWLFALDTARYLNQINNHYQPLQALYYDKSGQLKSFQVNCYAGGFPDLQWNRNGIMAVFPPARQAPPDSIVPLEKQLTFLKPLPQSSGLSENKYDYTVIVYWSRFMGRQSKRLIQTVQENCRLGQDKKIKVIYANTDNLFAGQRQFQ